MKLRDIIKNVDRSNPDNWTDLEQITKEFDIHDHLNGHDCKIKIYFYEKWYCTDTFVGGRVYYFEDEPICISYQSSRKCDEIFEWISRDAINKTRHYLTSLQEIVLEDLCPRLISEDIMNKDIGEGHKIEYSGQFLTDEVIFEETGEKVRIVEKVRGEYGIGKELKIKFADGEIQVVKNNQVIVPYCVTK